MIGKMEESFNEKLAGLRETMNQTTKNQRKDISNLTKHLQKQTYEPLEAQPNLTIAIPNLSDGDTNTTVADFVLRKLGYINYDSSFRNDFLMGRIQPKVFEACENNPSIQTDVYSIIKSLFQSTDQTELNDELASLSNRGEIVKKLNDVLIEISEHTSVIDKDVFGEKVKPLLQLIIQGVESKNA